MYQMWIPVYNREWNEKQRAELVSLLREAKTDLVLLVYSRVLTDDAMRARETEMFVKNRDFLRDAGFSVGAWLGPTIGYGAAFFADGDAAERFTHIRALRASATDDGSASYPHGKRPGEMPGAFCPSDERFVAEFLKTLSAVIGTGVDVIMFEDDFTLGGGKFFDDVGCACDAHIAAFCRRIGKQMTRREIADAVFGGGKNPYRDLWIKMQRETLEDFVRKIERTAHTQNPAVRIGLSANGSSYEMEGVEIDKLARIVAGNTRPFIRLTGAPYWTQSLTAAPAIEAVRMQTHFCDGGEIDLITEGDTYPRPRHWVPSALLEAYDMILRADGRSHGILKYMLDYNASPSYESGYIRRHVKNEAHYAEIARRFSKGRAVGIELYERTMTFRDRIFDEDTPIESFRLACGGYMPLAEQWLLADSSLPITYAEGEGALMVVGENAQYVSEALLKERGAILDIVAAKRLMARGIDVGIERLTRAPVPFGMYFHATEDYTLASLPEGSVIYDVIPKAGAAVDSDFVFCPSGLGVLPTQGLEECRRIPAVMRYENGDGMRFAILTFIPETVVTRNAWTPGIYRNYRMQETIAALYAWTSKKPLPAMCYGAPHLYILAKRTEDGSLAVGLWNLFPDPVDSPVIHLDRAYASVDLYHATGALDGDCVRIDGELPPYGFAFFTVT